MESDGMDQQSHLGDQSTSLLDPSLQMGSFGDGESNVWNHEFLLQNRNMQGYSVNEQVLTQTHDHQSYSTDVSSHQAAAKNQQILTHQNYNLLDDRVDSPCSVSRVGSWPMHVNSFQSQPGFEFSLLQPGYNTNVKQELMGMGSYPSTSMPPASYYQELSKQESHKLSGESACFTNPNKIVSLRPQQEYNMSSHGVMQPFFPTSKPSHDMLNTTMPMLDFLASQSMDMRQRLLPTSYMQDCKPKLHDLQNKIIGESPECSSEHKRNKDSSAGGGTNKKPRMDSSVSSSSSSSPSVPSFKLCLQVRKEKLGDRITALQQLVSPFGKTDTASVLLEAIGYIKFLQEQVRTLSTPYMEAVAATQGDSESDEPRGDLRSRGLCLVPISYTMHVANENGADFWSPNLGAAFR